MDFEEDDGRNDVSETEIDLCIPKTGTYRDTPETKAGWLGFTVSGSPLWHYNTSTDTNALELESLDTCGGHANVNGEYHYHGVILLILMMIIIYFYLFIYNIRLKTRQIPIVQRH